MKIGDKVRIIASLQQNDAASISHLIGQEYFITGHYNQAVHKNDSYAIEYQPVWVHDESFGGEIALVKGEYELM